MATRLLTARCLSRQQLLIGGRAAPAAVGKRSFAAQAESTENSLVKTALNDLHKELGGDMVPFAGYELPVLYKGSDNGGVMKEHLWCREPGKASLFDVSHMGQVRTECVQAEWAFIVFSFIFYPTRLYSHICLLPNSLLFF
jgi:Aminomethyltransferase folate-binding domain